MHRAPQLCGGLTCRVHISDCSSLTQVGGPGVVLGVTVSVRPCRLPYPRHL